MLAMTEHGGALGLPMAPTQEAGLRRDRVRSVLPQRLRVEVPEIGGDAPRAAGLAMALVALPGVTSATVSPLTGRALLHFGSPVEDLDAVLQAVVSAAAQAVPLDVPAQETSQLDQARHEAPLQRDWLRVIVGGVAVAGLLIVRLAGGPLALAAPPGGPPWPPGRPSWWGCQPLSTGCARCCASRRRRSTP